MSDNSGRPGPSGLIRAAARSSILFASAVALAAAGTLAAVPASGATALPVGLVANNGAVAHYDSNGNIVFYAGAGDASAESAEMYLPNVTATPTVPPSFTTDNFSAGHYPRWALSDAGVAGAVIYGYPAQIGGTANASFTGAQWTAGNGTTLETYQQALAQAFGTNYAAAKVSAQIQDFGNYTTGPMISATLTNVQFNGESPAPGTALTAGTVTAQVGTVGAQAENYQVPVTTTTFPNTLTYSANGTLPAGLSINSSTGVISGTPTAAGSTTATITVTDAAGDTITVPVSYTIHPSTGSICSASTGCAWQKLADPSSMSLYVQGQTPATNAPLVVEAVKAGDPAADFSAVASGFGASKQLKYTPYGTRAGAEADNPAMAAAAYSSSGSPLYCVSSIADDEGWQWELRPCATTANEWQDFVPGPATSHGSMIEPTYGKAGVSAGSSPMVANDYQFGGDGSMIISYPATGTGNELFTPGV